MKVGITAASVYIPYYRMERKIIAKAWERGAVKGERSVANTDEDSLTMAVEAAGKCFLTVERAEFDGLYFASTTAPYAEKSTSGTISTVCDLKSDVFTADFGNTTKAGTGALRAALTAVGAGMARNVLVTSADCRNGYPKSDQEQLFGDAAAAVAVGSKNVAAEFIACHSSNIEIIDIWRNLNEPYVNYGEGRFLTDKGYLAGMIQAVNGLLDKTGKKPADIAKVVLTSPSLKEHESAAKKLGFQPEQVQDAFMLEVGYCGAAQPLFLLTAALETAKAGDLILLAAYGNGADAFLFEVTENVKLLQKELPFTKALQTKRPLESYTKYLSFRGLLEFLPGEPFRTFPSNAATWREQKGIFKLYGSKCNECGAAIFPINRVCHQCGSVDQYSEIRLSDRKPKVFTYSIDNLAGRGDDPVVVQTVADDEEGIRYYLLMTDFAKEEIAIGMEVEFTFRRIYEGGNYINYYWKCRPVRKERK
jgi:3-hydroxy-3-methylglutaryl CoA synthase